MVTVLLIAGAVLVVLLILLRVADRRDARRGHVPRRMGDIRTATRAQRMDLRASRTARYLPRVLPEDPKRHPRPAKQKND